MPMTMCVIYPQSHCVCLFNLLVSGVDKLARGCVVNYNVQALQQGYNHVYCSLKISDLGVRGRHLVMSLYKLKASVTYIVPKLN